MRKEIPKDSCRPDPTFNQAPTGHKIPDGRSPDDPEMAFQVRDCGTTGFGEFSTPFAADERDLPCSDEREDEAKHQGN